ncbi:hypothetical protein ACWD6P_29905 [Streptomyces sp. NPDC002446]
MGTGRASPILDGRTRRTSSLEEKFELIASGQGIALVPVSIAGSYSRPDLVYLTVADALPVETCLAAPASSCAGSVVDLLDIATATLRGHSGDSERGGRRPVDRLRVITSGTGGNSHEARIEHVTDGDLCTCVTQGCDEHRTSGTLGCAQVPPTAPSP